MDEAPEGDWAPAIDYEKTDANITRNVLDARQEEHLAWAKRVFGDIPGVDVMTPRTRAMRFLEEAIELYQAVCASYGDGSDLEARVKAEDLVRYVFARSPGVPSQEVGGVAITLLSLCQRLGISFDECERAETARVSSIDVEKLRAKQLAKIKAGIEY